ncbi:hypothetical protein CHF27_008225 [Romboutsia maritimum]|uniref:DUF5673 domain-containing protein n=1 Tax=Romboutsia maritimum TaxID=2020948 RepID=A0A371ISK5_9FIRM|nr:permease prefix domain 1-containing protein [Romboutsia maritimum]RDY23462.1 hypothetical protein CHF27_008225 [Romboutsia maritimum]
MTKKRNPIENFLQSVCRFVSTEERAKDIRDELKDHIDSYIDEYTTDGMTIEDATSNALRQMGDPDTLSSNFKDNISGNKRLFVVGLIVSCMVIFLSINIYGYMNNIYAFSDIFICMIFLICYIPFLITLIKTYRKDIKLAKENPIFYIQSYKESAWYENILKPFKWLFIISFLLNIIVYFTELNTIPKNKILYETLETVPLLTMYLIMIIIFSCLSPKVQNNIVYPDGILTFQSFIPWNNIAGYRWVKQHSKNKVVYSIELKFKKNSSSNSFKVSSYSQFIKVSSYQMNLVDEIFKLNDIEHRQFF